MAQRPKRPRDVNQLAKLVTDIATGSEQDGDSSESDMVKLGRSGGLKGGRARAASLTPERRAEIARLAAQKRWAAKSKD